MAALCRFALLRTFTVPGGKIPITGGFTLSLASPSCLLVVNGGIDLAKANMN
jgi:hypothetical protein